MTEADLMHAIMIATCDDVDWLRNNVGAYDANPLCRYCGLRPHSGSARWIRYGVGGRGGADLLGVQRSTGRFVAAEIKTAPGIVSADQTLFLARVARSHGLSGVIRSCDDVIALLHGGS